MGNFKDVLDIVKPKNILEIGFFRGGSASLWLCGSDAKLTSVDPINDTVTIDYLKSSNQHYLIEDWQPQLNAVEKIKKAFPDRFEFIQKKSLVATEDGDLNNEQYDFAFIDGDHAFRGVTFDMKMAVQSKIPYLLFDDYWLEVEMAFSAFSSCFDIIKIYDGHKKFPAKGSPPMLLARNKLI